MKYFKTNELQQFEIDHNQTVRKNAAECTLFLKRNGDFPIKPCEVNLYGSGARATIKGGKGSGDVNTRYHISIEQGLLNAGFVVATDYWMNAYSVLAEKSVNDFWADLNKQAIEQNTSPYVLYMSAPRPVTEYDMLLNGTGDVNIYVIARDTSEGLDRENKKGDFQLLESEVRDIKILSAKKEKFLLVLNVGGVIDLSPVINDVNNILLLSQLGAETGNIFADILLGRCNPSGKLTATWAKNYTDYPSSDYFGMPTEVDYHEGVFVGYRYFDTFKVSPQFCFGYGKSYTDFSFAPIKFDIKDNQVTATVKVFNIGKFPGKEVIQIYYTKIGKSDEPKKQLIGFGKTNMLNPNQSQELQIGFDMTDAATFVKEQSAFVLEKGKYQIYIGNSIDNTVCAFAVVIESDFTTERVHRLTERNIDELKYSENRMEENVLLGEKVLSPSKVSKRKNTPYLSPKTSGMTVSELARLCVGVLNDMTLDNNIGNSGKKVAGSSGETYSNESIQPVVLADGPAGLRISPTYKLDENGRVKASDNALAVMKSDKKKDQADDGETYYQYCTSIPVGTALAQSWNLDLCEKMGDIVGKEMELFDVDIWLAPALNIHRNPLCGRNFEYYSEDPLVSGLMAAAITNGVQRNIGRSVTVKHFCCNNQETDRFFGSSNLSEKALREIYLKGFKICIEKANPNAMMTSYNLVNGTHTANCKELLLDVLRDEWGYEGLIMTDWMATGGMGDGVKYKSSSSVDCIIASNDLIMPGRDEELQEIITAAESGKISRSQLEACASRVLKLSEAKEQ